MCLFNSTTNTAATPEMYPAGSVTVTLSLIIIVYFLPFRMEMSWFISHLPVGEQDSIVSAVFMTPNVW